MPRICWASTCIAVLICAFSCQISVGQVAEIAQDIQPGKFTDAQFVEYEKQLNAILKTRRDEEKKFVNDVVKKVDAGKIPAKIVVSSFQWARNKRPNTKYPFIYFERVLRFQLTRIGLKAEVPPFDYGVYSKSTRK